MNKNFFDSKKIKQIIEVYSKKPETTKNFDKKEKLIIESQATEEFNQLKKTVIVKKKDINYKNNNFNKIPNETDKTIEKLFNIAQDKGVFIAIEVIKKMNNPYILDKFHDKLIEKINNKNKNK